jgi:hypothetical protein
VGPVTPRDKVQLVIATFLAFGVFYYGAHVVLAVPSLAQQAIAAIVTIVLATIAFLVTAPRPTF